MVRLFFTSVLSLCLSVVLYSQDRVNLKPDRYDAKSAQITYATLWRFDEPKWVSESNKNGHYSNFNYIRFARLKSNTDAYYVLINNFTDGEYKYPAIYEGWYEFNAIEFYAYTSEAYNQIVNIKQGETLILPYIGNTLWRSNWAEEYNEHRYIQKLKKYIVAYEQGKPIWVPDDDLFYIKRTKSEGQDVIRFWLPSRYFSEDSFERVYWEVPYSTFKNLYINE